MRPRIDLLLAAAVAMASLTHQARAVDASDTPSGANGDVISGKWVNPQSPGSHVRIFQNGNEFSAAGGAEVDTGPYKGMPFDATAAGRINGNSLAMIFTAILRNGVTVVGHCSGVLPTGGVIAWKCRDKNGYVSNSMWVRDPGSAPSPPAVAAAAPAGVSPPRLVAPAPVAALAPVANPAPAAAAVPTAPIESGRRVALVIGNSAYHAVGLLPNPTKDAELVGAAFRQAGIEVTVAHDLDREGIIAALKAFTRKANAADWAVIYYAGHGLEVGGTNYLIPVDATLETDLDVSDEAISLERMMSAIQGARRLKLVVLDACGNKSVRKADEGDGRQPVDRTWARAGGADGSDARRLCSQGRHDRPGRRQRRQPVRVVFRQEGRRARRRNQHRFSLRSQGRAGVDQQRAGAVRLWISAARQFLFRGSEVRVG